MRFLRLLVAAAALLPAVLCSVGCHSPYRADRGALVGGLGGAGVGAIIGNAVGNTGAGAAIGAGVGALSGAAIGGSLDEIEAKNRAEIAARMGRPVAAGAASMDDVIAMTRAGVPEEVIITHVNAHGMVAPLRAGDLIMLQQQGMPPRVVQAMQQPAVAYAPQPNAVLVAPGPVVYGPPPPVFYAGPSVHWGVGVGY